MLARNGGFFKLLSFILDRIGLAGRLGRTLEELWNAVAGDAKFARWSRHTQMKERLWMGLRSSPKVYLRNRSGEMSSASVAALSLEDVEKMKDVYIVGTQSLLLTSLCIPNEEYVVTPEAYLVLEVIGRSAEGGILMTEIRDALERSPSSENDPTDDSKKKKASKDVNYIVDILIELGLTYKELQTHTNRVWLSRFLKEGEHAITSLAATEIKVSDEPEPVASWVQREIEVMMKRVKAATGQNILAYTDALELIGYHTKRKDRDLPREHSVRETLASRYSQGLSLIEIKQFFIPKLERGARDLQLNQMREQAENEILRASEELENQDKTDIEPVSRPFWPAWCCVLHNKPLAKGKREAAKDARVQELEDQIKSSTGQRELGSIYEYSYLENIRLIALTSGRGGVVVSDMSTMLQANHKTLFRVLNQFEKANEANRLGVVRMKITGKFNDKYGIRPTEEALAVFLTSEDRASCISRASALGLKPRDPDQAGPSDTDDKREVRRQIIRDLLAEREVVRLGTVQKYVIEKERVLGIDGEIDSKSIKKLVASMADMEIGHIKDPSDEKSGITYLFRPSSKLSHKEVFDLLSKRGPTVNSAHSANMERKDLYRIPNEVYLAGVEAGLLKLPGLFSERQGLPPRNSRKSPKNAVEKASANQMRRDRVRRAEANNVGYDDFGATSSLGSRQIEKDPPPTKPLLENETNIPSRASKSFAKAPLAFDPTPPPIAAALPPPPPPSSSAADTSPPPSTSASVVNTNSGSGAGGGTSGLAPSSNALGINLRLYTEGYSAGQGLDLLYLRTPMKRAQGFLQYLLDFIKSNELEPKGDGTIPIDLREAFRGMPALAFVQIFKRNRSIFNDWDEDVSKLIVEAIENNDLIEAAVPESWFDKKDQPKDSIEVLRSIGILRARFVKSNQDDNYQIVVNDFVSRLHDVDGVEIKYDLLGNPAAQTSDVTSEFFEKLYSVAVSLFLKPENASAAQSAWYRPKSWGLIRYLENPPLNMFSTNASQPQNQKANGKRLALYTQQEMEDSMNAAKRRQRSESNESIRIGDTPSKKRRPAKEEGGGGRRKRARKVDAVALKKSDESLMAAYFQTFDLKRTFLAAKEEEFLTGKEMKLRMMQAFNRRLNKTGVPKSDQPVYFSPTSATPMSTSMSSYLSSIGSKVPSRVPLNSAYTISGWAVRNMALFGIMALARHLQANPTSSVQERRTLLESIAGALNAGPPEDVLYVFMEVDRGYWLGKKSLGELREARKAPVEFALRRYSDSSLIPIRSLLSEISGLMQRPRRIRGSALNYSSSDLHEEHEANSLIPVSFPISGKDLLSMLPKVAIGSARLLVNYEPDDLEPIRQDVKKAAKFPVSDLTKNEANYSISIQVLDQQEPSQEAVQAVDPDTNQVSPTTILSSMEDKLPEGYEQRTEEENVLLAKILESGTEGIRLEEKDQTALQQLISSGKVLEVPCFDHKRVVHAQNANAWTIRVQGSEDVVVPRRWYGLDGVEDSSFREELSRALVSFIFDYPGCTKERLLEIFHPVLDPIDIDDLLAKYLSELKMVQIFTHRNGTKTFAPNLSLLDRRFLFEAEE